MYTEIYYNLCSIKSKIKEEWTAGSNLHRHHIIPKHNGGLDEETNFTYLTIREHVIAHYLLWKIYKNPNDLRAMYMLGAKLTSAQRKIVGIWCRDNNIGFHGASTEEKHEWCKKGIETQIKNKIGIHNPKNFQKYAAIGGKSGSKSQIRQGIAIFNEEKRSEYASLGGKALTGLICVTNGQHRTRIKPEKLEEYIQNGYVKGFTLSS
jgi:hypothetical protein